MEWSEAQRKIITSFGRGMAVLAGAGCGKTTTLVEKCRVFIKQNPGKKILAISFTDRSANDLKSKLTESLGEEEASKHTVTTIHGLCSKIWRENPEISMFAGMDELLSESEKQTLWADACDLLWSKTSLPDCIEADFFKGLQTYGSNGLFELLGRMLDLRAFGLFSLKSDSTQELFRLGQYVIDRYDELKRKNGQFDFDDLERAAQHILQDPAIRSHYKKKYDLILVDEFQDTNPVQGELIRSICKDDLSNWVVVGDPKQSIYRFRDADLSVFEEACQSLPEKHSLSENYRSRPEILEVVNQVGLHAFDELQLPYEPLLPKRAAHQDPKMLSPVVLTSTGEPEQFSLWLKEQVKKGLRIEDTVILVKRIRGFERWIEALKAQGFSIRLGSGGSFWSDVRTVEAVSFLKWWYVEKSHMSGACFLKAPWVGFDDPWIDAHLSDLKSAFLNSDHPYAVLLKPFYLKQVRPGQLLEAMLDEQSERSDEIQMTLRRLWHECENLSLKGHSGMTIAQTLQTMMAENVRAPEIPPPRSKGLLQVLTIHSSKGLEFPHVILPDFSIVSRAQAMPKLFFNRSKGTFLTREKEEQGPEEKMWREFESFERRKDQLRLLYVAMTRAKERLVLVLPPAETDVAKNEWLQWFEKGVSAAPCKDTSGVWDLMDSSNSSYDDHSALYWRTKHSPQKIERFRSRYSITELNLLSRCEYQYYFKQIVKSPLFDEETPEIKHDTDSSRDGRSANSSSMAIGTQIHRYIETGQLDEWPQGYSKNEIDAWLKERPQDAKSYCEVPFELRLKNGETLVGAIDRMEVNAQGVSIIDFKVTERKNNMEQLQALYQTQMDAYAFAAHELTGMPIQGCSLVLIRRKSSKNSIEEIKMGSVSLNHERWIRLSHRANELMNWKIGMPNGPEGKPGFYCEYCKLRSNCSWANRVIP